MARTYRTSVAPIVYGVTFSLVWFAGIVGFVIIGDLSELDLTPTVRVAVTVGALLFALLPAFGIAMLPYKITLSNDGECEFRSVLRRKRVRVHQIRSIDWDEGEITIRHDRGKVGVLADRSYEDFLIRLFELNPAIKADAGVRQTLGISQDISVDNRS